ncbi:hypothetical protein Q2T40_01170 [Winogradskyella maritima]|nr:hypothetical protein [Winogradskyella maritima]
MQELQETYKNFELDYIKQHPDALITALLIDRAVGTRTVTAEEAQSMYDALSPEIKNTKIAKSIMEKLEAQKKAEENEKNTSLAQRHLNLPLLTQMARMWHWPMF